MSKLYGFKYTREEYSALNTSDRKIEYIILSKLNGRYFIDKFHDGTKYHFDITDKMDAFCKKIEKLNLNEWNMQYYDPTMFWFPDFYEDWTFQIQTDTINVMCKGDTTPPPRWNAFWKAFDKMCNNE